MPIDLELYREEVPVERDVTLSLIDVAPDRPEQTLVLIHGFGGRARQWRYQIEAFAGRNRIIAPDLRGHGLSSAPPTGYDMARLLQDLLIILENRQITRPVILVGHSFGGAIATDFALQHPERVGRLALIASAGEYQLARLFRFAFRLPDSVLRAIQPLIGNVEASLPALKQIYGQNLGQWNGWDKFSQLTMPTTVIMGERDRVFPQAAFARVGQLIPEAEVVNVGASAHMVMIERRDAVNRAIERLMENQVANPRWRNSQQSGSSPLLAERPWLAHYESAVPHTIDIPRLPLFRLLDRAWRRFPSRPAVRFMGRTLSYRTLSAQAGRFANALQALGIVKGCRVMLLLPNLPHLPIAYYGTLRLGAIVVMANPLAAPEEIIHQAKLSGAEVLVTLTRFQEVAQLVRGQSNLRHVIFASVGDYLPLLKQLAYREKALTQPLHPQDRLWRPLLGKHKPTPPQVDVRPEDIALIQFTSGTTAAPKGVTLTHRNLVANTIQIRAWLPNLRDGQETTLCVTPFSHVYGMTTGLNVSVSAGGCMVLLPTFDTEQVLQTIKQYKPTLFPGVPAMYVAINNFPNVRKYDIRSVQACISGAAPLPIEVKEAFEKLTKGRLVEGYGLSEASPVTHANPIWGQAKAGSIGLPLPNTEAQIVDLRTRKPLPAGQIGELAIRGPQVMAGYWQNEAATQAVLDNNGWLYTNDIARMDADGYFQIISRRQDMWQADETPAFPRDVEEIIYEIPEVREVVIVAIANRPVAFVSMKDKARLPAKTIIAFCERRLPPAQVPRLVIFVKDFPRSFIGKVLRRELVNRYAHEITAEAGSVGEHLAGLGESDE